MTTIGKSMFPLKTSYTLMQGMKARFDQLQEQLATGKNFSTLSQMGSSRFLDLTMRARLGKMESYSDTMQTVNLRLSVLDTSMTRLTKIEQEQRTSATPGGHGTGNVNFATSPTVSRARFDEVMDLLNANVAGRYVFSGATTDKKPVADAAALMDGAGGRAGFKQVVGERKLADRGADGLGRLALGSAANAVTLAEDGSHPFGLKLSTLSSSSADIALTQPTGSPPQLGIAFNGASLPVEGSTVTIGFTLPDGTSDAITLTATTGTPSAGQFQIGADADTTAANFAAAMQTAIEGVADTSLSAASTYAAAENFFNGQGEQVMRVDGPPFETATGLVAATAGNTMLWYAGADDADARAGVDAKVADGTSVKYGVQANESGIVKLVQTLAAMAVETYPEGDPTSGARFDEMASRQIERLSTSHTNTAGSLQVIGIELAVASTTIANVQERQNSHKVQLETMLSEIETAPIEEISMEILALKTRMEASYATTALVSQLSLVNYLP